MHESEPALGDANGILAATQNGIHQSKPSTSVAALQKKCQEINDNITLFLDLPADSDLVKSVQDQTRTALGVIDQALETYSLSEISLSYNGGKDCLVLLILYLAALHNHHQRHCVSPSSTSSPCQHFNPIRSVYIRASHPFHEVESFVTDSISTYSLELARYTSPSMKAAFAQYLADNPHVRLIFVGTRRTDPHGALLTHFDATDRGWPAFMRGHPVIDWKYVEVWAFIRELRIPYCHLYDLGYTSLGGTNDTLPNPALRLPGSTPIEPRYRPAYELVEDDEERLGRERVGQPVRKMAPERKGCGS